MGRCDSFVVETDVHYPTDINLLFDAIRKMIRLATLMSQSQRKTLWWQYEYNIRSFKKLFRRAQQLKRSTSKNEKKKVIRERLIINAHKIYIEAAQGYIQKAIWTLDNIRSTDPLSLARAQALENFISHAKRQINQIHQRVIQGKKIPNQDKVFSIFQPHTEWISKGKASVPQELGLRVCILEDQSGLILHHRVMEKETDDKIAVSMVESALKKFPNLKGCSFDKGFYSPSNKKGLKTLLKTLVLPKKGKRNKAEHKEETSEEFIRFKRKHSAVESAVNGLENHGLDRCFDHGIHGFKRYISLAVLSRNLQIIGHDIQQKKMKQLQRSQRQAV
jgi:transposase, IS5 family